eukprot:CFRG4573T1
MSRYRNGSAWGEKHSAKSFVTSTYTNSRLCDYGGNAEGNISSSGNHNRTEVDNCLLSVDETRTRIPRRAPSKSIENPIERSTNARSGGRTGGYTYGYTDEKFNESSSSVGKNNVDSYEGGNRYNQSSTAGHSRYRDNTAPNYSNGKDWDKTRNYGSGYVRDTLQCQEGAMHKYSQPYKKNDHYSFGGSMRGDHYNKQSSNCRRSNSYTNVDLDGPFGESICSESGLYGEENTRNQPSLGAQSNINTRPGSNVSYHQQYDKQHSHIVYDRYDSRDGYHNQKYDQQVYNIDAQTNVNFDRDATSEPHWTQRHAPSSQDGLYFYTPNHTEQYKTINSNGRCESKQVQGRGRGKRYGKEYEYARGGSHSWKGRDNSTQKKGRSQFVLVNWDGAVPLKAGVHSPQRKLVILDMNGLLVHRYRLNTEPKDAPVSQVGGRMVVLRPYVNEFIDYLFSHFEVGVWSSMMGKNVRPIVELVFRPECLKNLYFVLDQSACDSIRHREVKNKPLLLKDLHKIWNADKNYNPQNTLLIDDSPLKATRNPPNLLYNPVEWEGDMTDTALSPDGGTIYRYIEGLAQWKGSVAEYVVSRR